MPLLTPQLCYYGDAISGYHRLSDHAQAPVTRISGRWRAVAGIRPDYAKMFGLQSPDPRDEMREREERERGFPHRHNTYRAGTLLYQEIYQTESQARVVLADIPGVHEALITV